MDTTESPPPPLPSLNCPFKGIPPSSPLPHGLLGTRPFRVRIKKTKTNKSQAPPDDQPPAHFDEQDGSVPSTSDDKDRSRPSSRAESSQPSKSTKYRENDAPSGPGKKVSRNGDLYRLPVANEEVPTLNKINEHFILILQPVDPEQSFSKVNPLKTKAELIKICAKGQLTYLRRGAMVVKTKDHDAARKIVAGTSLNGIKYTSSTPRSSRETKGIIRFVNSHLSNEEIVHDINSGDNPESVKAIAARYLGNEVSGVRVVTFSGTSLPKEIVLCCSLHQVRIFYEDPTQCFNCQAFGHVAMNCRRKMRCLHCGERDHSHKQCVKKQSDPICCNCMGRHAAWSGKCPAKLVQIEICKEKAASSLSYSEARERVFPRRMSFAEALRRRSNRTGEKADPGRNPVPPAENLPPLCPPVITKPTCQPPAAPAVVPTAQRNVSYAQALSVASPTLITNEDIFCNFVTLIQDLCTSQMPADRAVEKVIAAAKFFGCTLKKEKANSLFFPMEDDMDLILDEY